MTSRCSTKMLVMFLKLPFCANIKLASPQAGHILAIAVDILEKYIVLHLLEGTVKYSLLRENKGKSPAPCGGSNLGVLKLYVSSKA